MTAALLRAFVDTVAFEGPLAAEWRGSDAPSAVNGDVALAFALAQQLGEERWDAPDGPDVQIQSLRRLEAKLNLCLMLLGRVLASGQASPLRQSVRFNAHGLAWRQPATTFAPAPRGSVRIVLDEVPALPFELPSTLAVRVSRPDEIECVALFDPLSTELADAIQRYVFRAHRRRVAETRGTR